MTFLLITILVAAALFAAYWFALRNREPALGEGKQPEKLPPAPSDKPTLQQKLDQRREQMKGEKGEPPATPKAAPEPPPSEKAPPAGGPPPPRAAPPPGRAEAPPPEKAAPPPPPRPPPSARAPRSAAAARDAVRDLRKGLSRSREGFFGRLVALVSGKASIDPALVDELEEVLVKIGRASCRERV